MLISTIIFTALLFLGHLVKGDKNADYCAVCRALIVEVNWKISQVDPKRSIQAGSFRVDSNGNQNIKDKKYARSNTHLEEMFETICSNMLDYGEVTLEDGSVRVVRTRGLDGQNLETKDLNLNWDKGNTLKYRCDDFLENHEEVVITLLQRENIPDYEKVICGEETRVCTSSELATPMHTLSEALEPEEVDSDNEEDNDETQDEEVEEDESDMEKQEL